MEIHFTLKKLKVVMLFCLLIVQQHVWSQSNHTVSFSGNTSDFNAAEKYSSVDNVDYYVTYDANYIYFGAFRTGGNSWGTFDHFTIYADDIGTGTGSSTGETWDSNTPTLPFAADYRICIRNNSSGESFYSTYSSGWTTGAANAQGWTQYTTTGSNGALEVRVPWSDLGSPDAIRFHLYASYNGGFFGAAPNGTSGNAPSTSDYFGAIGTKSADCIPTRTTNLSLTGTGTITNTAPASGTTYARVIVNTGTINSSTAWTLAPGGIIEVSGGTLNFGAQTITMGNASYTEGTGTTINTSGAGAINMNVNTVWLYGGEGNITGNNLSVDGIIRIQNKFTPLASGGLTFNSGAALDIRSSGYINTNAPNYATGSYLKYNSGGNYVAGTEWTPNILTGTGVPSHVSVGDLVASSQLDFGTSSQYRQLSGNLLLSATATLTLASNIGGDLQIGGNFTNTAGSVLNTNSRAVIYNGNTTQTVSSTAVNFSYLIISNTSAQVSATSTITISNNLTIDAGARLNIAANTLDITGAVCNVNGYLRSAGTVTGASALTLIINNGGTYEHNYTTSVGVIPTATWNTGSNCDIIGYTAALAVGAGSGYDQTFSNFTWNCTGQNTRAINLASYLTDVTGNLSILSTGTTGTLTLSSTASTTINIGGDLIQSGGICYLATALTNINVSGDVVKTGGTLYVTNNTAASVLQVNGAFLQSLGATVVSSAASGSPQLNVSGICDLSGGTFTVALGNATAQANITGKATISGGTLVVSSGAGAAQFNANNDFEQNGGTLNISTGTGAPVINIVGDFTVSAGNISETSTGNGTIAFIGTINQNVNITVPGNITNTIHFKLNNTAGITIVNGSIIPINSTARFILTQGSVSVSGTGAMEYNPVNSTLYYNVAADYTTTDNEWPNSNGPVHVTIANSVLSNIFLHSNRTLPASGVLTLAATYNRLVLGANDLTITNTAAAAVVASGNTASMVVVDGTGRLIRSIATGITYVWPIGDMTGTIEYSPVTALSFTATSVPRDIGFNITNATHSQMHIPDPQAHYRNRYFGVYNSAGGTYTYNATFNFLAADNVGTPTNTKINAYTGGGWTQAPATTSAATTLRFASSVDETIFPLVTGYEIVGRSTPQVYSWIPTSGTQSFAVAANWSPNRNVLSFDDILTFPNGGSSVANTITNQSIGKIAVSNNTDITLLSSAAATLALTGVNGDDFLIASGSSLTIGGAPSTTALTIAHSAGSNNTAIVDGSLNTATNTGIGTYSAANSTTTINGTVNNNGSFVTTASTTLVNGTFNNLTVGATTSSAATLTFASGSNYNFNRNAGVVTTATWDINSNCYINGVTGNIPTGFNQAFGNFTWNCTSQSASLVMGANLFTTVNGNLSFLSTNNSLLSISSTASTINVGGNLLIDINTGTLRLISANLACVLNINGNTTINSGTLQQSSTASSTLNFLGNLNLSGGTLSRTAGVMTVNFVKPSLSQSITQTSGTINGIINWNVGNGTSTNTLLLSTNINLGGAASTFTVKENASLDCGTKELSNATGAFTLSATSPGATLITAHADGIEYSGAIGSIQTSGARNFNAGANYTFNGTAAQVTGTGLTSARDITINNLSNVSLSGSVTLSNSLIFTNGRLVLGNFDLTQINTSVTSYSGINNSSYIVTNGTGQLLQRIPTAGLPINFLLPVGDAANYSPVQLNFSANSTIRDVGVIVTPGAVPNNLPSTDYINRRWTFSNSAAGTYTYIPTFTFKPADVVGVATNMKISRYVGPLWNEYNSTPNTSVVSPDMTLTGSINETSGALSSYWTGRVYAPPVNYVWNGSTSNNWNTATNWTPNGVPNIIDNVTISVSAPNPCVASSGAFNVNNFTVSGTGNFQLGAGANLTVNGTFNITATATFNCSSSLYLSTLNPLTIPALNYGNLDISGGNRTLANSGTIGICGSFNQGAGIITVTGSTVNYNSTSTQTISKGNYQNLIISQNRGGATLTLEPGTITVAGNFSPTVTNYSPSVDGNTFHFAGANGQIIPAFYYFNITSTDFTRSLANSGVIDVKGSFAPAATKVNTITGSTVRFSSTLPGIILNNYTTNVGSRLFNNLIFDGVGGSWSSGSVTLGIDGTLVMNNGILNIGTTANGIIIVDLTTTINGGVFNLTSATGTGIGTFTGIVTVTGGEMNISNGTTGAGVGTATLGNQLNITGGIFAVVKNKAPGNLTINNNLSLNGGTFMMTYLAVASGAPTVTLNGNLALNSGTFTKAGYTPPFFAPTGCFNFNFSGWFATRTFSQTSATVIGNTYFQCTGSPTTNALQINSNLNLGSGGISITNTGSGSGYSINLRSFVISSSGMFRIANGGRLRTEHPDGFSLAPAASGCIQTATRSLGGSCLWSFEGSGLQKTGNGFPASVDQLSVNNSGGGLELQRSVRIQNVLTLTNCHMYLGNYDLTMQASASYSGGASKMIVTNGNGMLVRIFNGPGSYTYPIGDNTGTVEYSPVTINFSSLSNPDSVGFRVTNTQHPNDFSLTDYLKRYWTCDSINSPNYTYTASFTYVQADVVGSETGLKVDRWSNPLSTWTQDAGSSVNTLTNVLTTSTLNQTTGTLLHNDFIGRSNAPLFYQSATSGNWSSPSVWEVSSDPLFVSPPGVPAVSAPDDNNSIGIFIRNTHNIAIASATVADQVTIDVGGTLTINSSQTFTIPNGTGTDLTVEGTLNNQGTISNTGTIEFNSGGVYNHNQNGGTIPTATWNTGSLCQVTGVNNTVPAGINQSFYNFEWNCASQSTYIHLSGALTTVSNNFSLVNTGSPSNDLRMFNNNSSGTLNIGGNLTITGGRLALVNSLSSGSGNAVINVQGNLTVSSGILDMTGSSAFTAGSSNLTTQGDFTVSGTGSIVRSQNVLSQITLNKASGSQAFNIATNSINSSDIKWQIGDGVTTNTVTFNSSVAIHSAASFTLATNATLNCQNYILTGGSFNNQTNSNLGIGSADGIVNAPTAMGNIQTTSRTFLSSAHYIYNGLTNQNTGNGLPATHSGMLTIDNQGGGGNNTVSLSVNNAVGNNLVLANGILAIGIGQQYNISNAGSVNATSGDFATGTAGGILNFNASGTFSGSCNPFMVYTSGAVDFGSGTVTIQNNGVFRINTGGSAINNGPYYALGSTLEYYPGGTYNRGIEWNSTSGRGYPHHVQVANNTTFNPAGLGAINAAVALNTGGDLYITSGSSFDMSSGGNNMTVPLDVSGSIIFAGTLKGSGAAGGHIELNGNWTNNGASILNFIPNNRSVVFNGSALQTIGGSNTTVNPFDDLSINNSAGVTLSSINAQVKNTLTLSTGKFDLNNNVLTIGYTGNNGAIIGGSSSSYIISGLATAQVIRYTTSNNTTYNFPIGDVLNYSPIDVQFNNDPMAGNTTLTVAVLPIAHPDRGTATNYLSRYWIVEPSNLPSVTTSYGVVYQYANIDINGVEANLKPFKHNSLGWIAAVGSGANYEMGTGSLNVGTNTITWTGLNNFSDFTGLGNGTPLPINLLSFDVQALPNEVKLSWSTATEVNNDFFTIERSTDGISFEPIGEIDGAGNSNQILSYVLYDEKPLDGTSFYRLKQTDFDGQWTYSTIKAVSYNIQAPLVFAVYPNPSTNGGVHIQIPSDQHQQTLTINLVDMLGHIIESKQVIRKNATEVYFMDISSLSNGFYQIQILNDDHLLYHQKISIIK